MNSLLKGGEISKEMTGDLIEDQIMVDEDITCTTCTGKEFLVWFLSKSITGTKV